MQESAYSTKVGPGRVRCESIQKRRRIYNNRSKFGLQFWGYYSPKVYNGNIKNITTQTPRMPKTIRYYIVGNELHRWINNIPRHLKVESDFLFIETVKPIEADFFLFLGGADIDPKMYGEENTSRLTHTIEKRDTTDTEMFVYAQEHNIMCVGICRGSQFLTAKAGGRLIQDVGGHTANHHIMDWHNNIYWVTSTHHQMMYPYDLPDDSFRIIATAQPKKSQRYLNGKDENFFEGNIIFGSEAENFTEPEVVYYPKIKSLAIQAHPELLSDGSDSQMFFSRMVLALAKDKEINFENTKLP